MGPFFTYQTFMHHRDGYFSVADYHKYSRDPAFSRTGKHAPARKTHHFFQGDELDTMRTTPLICLCGPSGTGKTTISFELERAFNLLPVVSYTTRPAREGEVDDRDYKFRTRKWMDDHRGMFSWDWGVFGGNVYAASDEDILSRDVIVIHLDDALDLLRDSGVPVFIVWINGPCRADRVRDDNVVLKPEHLHKINHVLDNNEDRSVESCAAELFAIYCLLEKTSVS